jgi:hexosaminidase
LWPIPTGNVTFSKNAIPINPNMISFSSDNFEKDDEYFPAVKSRFIEMQKRKIPKKYPVISEGKELNIIVKTETDDMTFNYDTKEGYQLTLDEKSDEISVEIIAENFFGIRHGIETLSQLIVHDELNQQFVMLSSASIIDEPKFRHRGLSMDTSRTFFPLEVIKRTINGLAMVKMNTFHWHIIDAQSFPMQVKLHPDFTKYGAYSRKKIYTGDDIKEIVKFALARGVRVIPEFDAPAHIGEGWQKKLHLTTCFNAVPFTDYCHQPPCGHIDPSKDEVYDVLEDIYGEMIENFNPSVFHMGGDEIFFSCWNTSESLRNFMTEKGYSNTDEGFIKLWGYFQQKAQERLDAVSNNRSVQIMLWTSELTDVPHISQYLDKNRYIIQAWTAKNDPKIMRLLEDGYKMVISNYDALYLDCGYGNFAYNGLVWCSPYHDWQKIYKTDLKDVGKQFVDQIYGAEATIWSEAIDQFNIDSRIWPRLSALAERLWSGLFLFYFCITLRYKLIFSLDPSLHWRSVEPRILYHALYLKEVGGLAAEILQMEWCLQAEGLCQI